MKPNIRLLIWISTVALVFVISLAALAAPEAAVISSWVIGAGGDTINVGNRTLQYTLGQPVVGEIEVGARVLCSGYWCDPLYHIYLPMVVRNA